jgi:Spy/CpxP family protein refolding chaperone
MKLIAALVLFATFCTASAAEPGPNPGDPLAGAFFPPEAIMGAGEQLGLTQEQKEAIHARMEKTQAGSDELRQRLEREAGALAKLVNQPRVDEPALMAQLDKVLDAERELKHLHVGLLAALKNILTPEQQAKLHEMHKGGGAPGIDAARRGLMEKVERVGAMAQKWAASGRDTSGIAKMMDEKIQPLIAVGKVDEASAMLDHLLERLQQPGQ